MRDIKFRGKCVPDSKYAGEWVTGGYVSPDAECKNQDEGLIVEYLGGNTTITYHVDPDTVGQYTGLTDKNGVEIYEGDVVMVTNLQADGFGKQMKTTIVYDEELACFDFKALDRQRCICNSVLETELEVIGNICDNPELLEKE